MGLPKKTVGEMVGFFKAMNSNIATNKLAVQGNDVRGYVGIDINHQIKSLKGGFCWGHGASLESIVFEIQFSPIGPISFQYLECPSAYNVSQANKLVEDFVKAMKEPALKKMADKVIGYKGGGKYSGLRLEAHDFSRTITRDHFNSVIGQKFTQIFVDLARKLNVTYK